MGNLAFDLMAQGKTVLFSFEEAIGESCLCDIHTVLTPNVKNKKIVII